jgi:hypothetical protein
LRLLRIRMCHTGFRDLMLLRHKGFRALAARRSSARSKPSAGARLIAELSKDDDPYSLTFLIEQAGHTADYLERLRQLIDGDRDSWVSLKLGAKTVEVIVNKPLIESRAQAEQLRKLLAEIHKQRASIPIEDEDDVLDDDD